MSAICQRQRHHTGLAQYMCDCKSQISCPTIDRKDQALENSKPGFQGKRNIYSSCSGTVLPYKLDYQKEKEKNQWQLWQLIIIIIKKQQKTVSQGCLKIFKDRKKGLISSTLLIWLVSKVLKITLQITSFCIWESPSRDLCKEPALGVGC